MASNGQSRCKIQSVKNERYHEQITKKRTPISTETRATSTLVEKWNEPLPLHETRVRLCILEGLTLIYNRHTTKGYYVCSLHKE